MLMTAPCASPGQDATGASSVLSSQAGGNREDLVTSPQHPHHGDRVVTHIAAVIDYAAGWPRGPWGTWGPWGTLQGERRCVRVLQSGQSP